MSDGDPESPCCSSLPLAAALSPSKRDVARRLRGAGRFACRGRVGDAADARGSAASASRPPRAGSRCYGEAVAYFAELCRVSAAGYPVGPTLAGPAAVRRAVEGGASSLRAPARRPSGRSAASSCSSCTDRRPRLRARRRDRRGRRIIARSGAEHGAGRVEARLRTPRPRFTCSPRRPMRPRPPSPVSVTGRPACSPSPGARRDRCRAPRARGRVLDGWRSSPYGGGQRRGARDRWRATHSESLGRRATTAAPRALDSARRLAPDSCPALLVQPDWSRRGRVARRAPRPSLGH